MSRARQALLLGRHLTEVTCVEATLEYVRGAKWSMRTGPTAALRDAHTPGRGLAGHRLTEMRPAVPAQRKARREYTNRVSTLTL
ncbi:hypothetical protein [Streptomyces niveus]|uniref:Uncharacterized protein n=1 Tax=Streptomyces niveus TaxID=193462 RepID=A0A1U9QL13_STRNV|nr:hypothetical protein [Streptomyces niveus]AQU64966.1 hypothetical protein BBN63_00465 [Streptomyces niveus]